MDAPKIEAEPYGEGGGGVSKNPNIYSHRPHIIHLQTLPLSTYFTHPNHDWNLNSQFLLGMSHLE